MKLQTKFLLVAAVAVIAAFVVGVFAGARIAGHFHRGAISGIRISQAAATTTRCVELLRATRVGEHDEVRERLERDLDSALVQLAEVYTPERDQYGVGADSLTLAREYRAAHPRTANNAYVDERVRTALALQTGLPPP